MNTLAILAEDENDEIFYEACAEKISGLSFGKIDPHRIRKNGGVSAVRQVLPAFLNDLKGVSQIGDTYFIIALDNDRAPEHPDHQKLEGLSRRDHNQQCRYCELSTAIADVFGHNKAKWPAKGAITIPVQMLESWVLLAINPERAELPVFSRKTSSSARAFYHGSPPDQLKDLCNKEKNARQFTSNTEFFLEIAQNIDVEAVSAGSPSFRNFCEQVSLWKT